MGQKTSFMGHITDSTKGRAKRIGRSFRLFQRSPPVFFFFFFQLEDEKNGGGGEKGNSGGRYSAATSGALMGVNAMCKRAIAPTALFCSSLPSFFPSFVYSFPG